MRSLFSEQRKTLLEASRLIPPARSNFGVPGGAAQATRARTRWPRCLYCGEAQLCGWSSRLLESFC